MKINLKNVQKKYGDFEALKGVSLTFEAGKFYGLLGPNGAGKTTLFHSLIRTFPITAGEMTWENQGQPIDFKHLYKHIGVVFQDSRLDKQLTVAENLIARGAMYHLTKREVLQKITTFESYLSISSIQHRKYGELSGGQKRKVDIARALLHDPSLLLLDEPTTGLDPKSRNDLWAAIYKLNKKKQMTVVLITHYLDEMKDCDVLNVLIEGQLHYSGSVAQFIAKNASTNLILQLKENQTVEALTLSAYAQKITVESSKKLIIKDLTVDNILEILANNQLKHIIANFEIEDSNLETAYLNLLKKQLGDSYERIAE